MKASYIIIASLVLLSGCKHNRIPPQIDIIYKETIIDGEISAIDYYQKLNEYFIEKNAYPVNYRGAYINEDEMLVINISNEDSLDMRNYISGIINSNDFKINTVVYSSQYLKHVMDTINHFVAKNTGDPISQYLTAWGTYEKNNCIEVIMIKYNPEIIESFTKQVTSSPAVRFKISGRVERIANGGGGSIEKPSNIMIKVIPDIVEKEDTYIEYKINNHTSETLILGDEYIEFFNGSCWDRIIIEGFINLDVLPTVDRNRSQSYKLALHRELYDYLPGLYRVLKVVYPESGWNDKANREEYAIYLVSDFVMK